VGEPFEGAAKLEAEIKVVELTPSLALSLIRLGLASILSYTLGLVDAAPAWQYWRDFA
jgi:hypothetical protein